MIKTKIEYNGESWTVHIIGGNKDLPFTIEGCESKEIARHQAKIRRKELKKAGLL
jgi:hypothetical protein